MSFLVWRQKWTGRLASPLVEDDYGLTRTVPAECTREQIICTWNTEEVPRVPRFESVVVYVQQILFVLAPDGVDIWLKKNVYRTESVVFWR